MMVELLVRYGKNKKTSDLTDEDLALIQSKRILEEGYDYSKDKEFVSYSYDLVTLNFKDICEIMRLDDQHTQINKYNNTMWIAKLPYNEFKDVYTQVTGTAIMITSPSQMG